MKRGLPQAKDYTTGWVCALPIEFAAAQEVLDEEHDDVNCYDNSDTNSYSFGRIGNHNIVIACLPAGKTGNNSAATVASQLKARFPSIEFGLLVGIGGGVPSNNVDIRLGDVVISQPDRQHGGVIQYDFGKTTPMGFERTGFLSSPPSILLSALAKFRANVYRGKSKLSTHIASFSPSSVFSRRHTGMDVLFEPAYNHVPARECELCDPHRAIKRSQRDNDEILVHYGTIASGNKVMRDGVTRDLVSKGIGGVLCFEMEAAGLMNVFPCLVIRGICDYSDSHKNKTWQAFASATAAACAKEILLVTPSKHSSATSSAKENNATSTIQPTTQMLRSMIDNIDLDNNILAKFPVADQQGRMSNIPPVDRQDSRFCWVFENIEFEKWTSGKSQVLWMSAPLQRHIEKVSSLIATGDLKKTATGAFSLFYFFFLEEDIEDSITLIFILTLIGQMARFSSSNGSAIIRAFLHHLLDSRQRREKEWQKLLLLYPNGRSTVIDEILRAPHEDLWEALKSTLRLQRNRELSIVIDGLGRFQYLGGKFYVSLISFVDFLISDGFNFRMFITSLPNIEVNPKAQIYAHAEYDKERRECLHSLRFSNMRLKKISPEHEGSCDWLWLNKQYKDWSDSKTSSLLLIEGKPGSGKSTLTKYFYSNLRRYDVNHAPNIIAKFFYSYRDGELEKDHRNMLKSILHDVLEQDETFFYRCYQKEFRKAIIQGNRADWTYEALKRVLKLLPANTTAKRLVLIIDAMDESNEEDRRDILELLLDICNSQQNCTVKALVASRPMEGLQSRRHRVHNFIRLQDETKEAISDFTISLLRGLRVTRLLDRAAAYIVDHAQGVFLWVKLIGDELLQCEEAGTSEDETFEFLKRLPTDLEDFYRRMLEKIKDRGLAVQDATRMFQIVLHAREPLTTSQLLHAIGILNYSVPSKENLDRHFPNFVPSDQRIIFCGGNFLEIKERQGYGTVQFIHQTAREFFLYPKWDVTRSILRVSQADSHMCITTACIRYLKLCSASATIRQRPSELCDWTLQDFAAYTEYLDGRPLTSYAIRHLEYHFERCQCNLRVEAIASEWEEDIPRPDPIMKLIRHIKNLQSNLQMGETSPSDDTSQFISMALYVAASNGLAAATETFVSAGANCNFGHGEEMKTPLMQAIKNGHEAVVRVLTGAPDIDTDLVDGDGQTPLSYAAQRGEEAMVKLLLGLSYTDPDAKRNSIEISLVNAASHGHFAVTKMLLNVGEVDPNLKCNNASLVLSCAAQNGHDSIVKLLIEITGVDINDSIYCGMAPLSHAASRGHEKAVEVLIDTRFATPDCLDIAHRTPLSYAAQNGYEVIARNLLETDRINPDIMDLFQRTPTSYAAQNGHTEIIKLLLNTGKVNPDSADYFQRTPISYAAQYGREDVVKLLLDTGKVNPNSKDYLQQTPCTHAAQKGHKGIVKILQKFDQMDSDPSPLEIEILLEDVSKPRKKGLPIEDSSPQGLGIGIYGASCFSFTEEMRQGALLDNLSPTAWARYEPLTGSRRSQT